MAVQGYLALAKEKGPAVIVVHEWWGLNDHIKDVCDRFAKEGFNAFGIDLYKEEPTKDPVIAQRRMTNLVNNRERVLEDIKEAIDYLNSLSNVEPKNIGITGFCMGGAVTLYAACELGDKIKAAAPFYGMPKMFPLNFDNLKAKVLGLYAGEDPFIPKEDIEYLKYELEKRNKGTLYIYPGVNHAFFNNTRTEVYNEEAAKDAWHKVIEFFKKELY